MGRNATILICLSTLVAWGCAGNTLEEAGNTGGSTSKTSGTGGSTSTVCSPGNERCPCRIDGSCNQGLECHSDLCVAPATGGEIGGTTSLATPATGGTLPATSVGNTAAQGGVIGTGGWISGGASTTGNSGGIPSTSSYSSSLQGTGSAGFGNILGGAAATGGNTSLSWPSGGTSTVGGASSGGASPVDPFRVCTGVPFPQLQDDAGTCGESFTRFSPPQFDLMLAIDRTASMTYCLDGRLDACGLGTAEPSRWMILQQGLQLFFADTGLTGPELQPRLGLRFFGSTGIPDDPLECQAETYATPQVAVQDFATATASISNAIDVMANNLGGQTPWQPALQGVLQFAQQWQALHWDRMTAVVFITDGYPTECDTNIADTVQTAGEFARAVMDGAYNVAGGPAIRTHVIVIGGDVGSVSRYKMDQVASAGATTEATVVGVDGSANDIATALRNIVHSTPGGELMLPSPSSVTNARLAYLPLDQAPQEIPRLDSAAQCDGEHGGWYVKNPLSPDRIDLCPCSYANTAIGELRLVTGCD